MSFALEALVAAGITEMNGRLGIPAKQKSETAVKPDDVSTTVVPSLIHSLHSV